MKHLPARMSIVKFLKKDVDGNAAFRQYCAMIKVSVRLPNETVKAIKLDAIDRNMNQQEWHSWAVGIALELNPTSQLRKKPKKGLNND